MTSRFIHLKIQSILLLFAVGIIPFIITPMKDLRSSPASAFAAVSPVTDGGQTGRMKALAALDHSVWAYSTAKQFSAGRPVVPAAQVYKGDQIDLPLGARARFGRGTMRTLALSPDGSILVTGGSIGVFAFRRGSFTEEWHYLQEAPVSQVKFSADGKIVAAVSGGAILLLSATSGEVIDVIRPDLPALQQIVFAPTGEQLALVTGLEVQIWDIPTGEFIASRLLDEVASDIVWSPDSHTLALGLGSVTLWDLDSDTLNVLESGAPCSVTRIDWSADGRVIAAGLTNGGVLVWDMASKQARVFEPQHSLWVNSVAISKDGSLLASGGKDGNVILWDVRTGVAVHKLAGHRGEIIGLAFGLLEAEIISGAVDGAIIAWDPIYGEQLAAYVPHTLAINAIAWSPQGAQIATGTMDGAINLWDAHSGQPSLHIAGNGEPVESMFWSPDGNYLASLTSENAVSVWDAKTGGLAKKLVKQPKVEAEAVFMPDGTPVGGEIDGAMLAAAFSPDGVFLAASVEDTRIYVWNLESGELIRVLDGHTLPVYSLEYLSNGRELASMSMDGTFIRWDLESGEQLDHRFYPGMVGMVISPDEHWLAISDWYGRMELWRRLEGSPSLVLDGSSDAIISAEFSPDGSRLVTGVEGNLDAVIVWELSSGEEVAGFSGHTFDVREAAFSPDGDILATASWDGTVLLWDLVK